MSWIAAIVMPVNTLSPRAAFQNASLPNGTPVHEILPPPEVQVARTAGRHARPLLRISASEREVISAGEASASEPR